MKPSYEELEQQLAAVVAENAGLKAAIETHKHGFVRCNCCGDELMCHTDDVCRALDETPATDAFLDEVRAQGVEMAACALDDVNQFNYANMLDDLAQKLRKGA